MKRTSNHAMKQQVSMETLASRKHVVYWLPGVLACLVYLNGLQGQFVHDDVFAIQNNPDVTGKSPVSELFWNDFWGTRMSDPTSHKSYRPLTTLTFRLDYYLSPGSPVWFHVVNTILHVAVTLTVTYVCLHVLNTTKLCALLTGVLFAVHPIHTEAVTGLVGRADVLAALFFLLSFSLYAKCMLEGPMFIKDVNDNKILSPPTTSLLSRQQAVYLLASMVLAAAAMLCKETGPTVLGVALVFDVIAHRKEVTTFLRSKQMVPAISRLVLRVVCVLVMGGMLLAARMWIMRFEQPTFRDEDNPAAACSSVLTRLLTFLYLPTFNLWLLLCPAHLGYDWSGGSIPLVQCLDDPRNLVSLVTYAGLSVIVLRCLQALIAKEDQNGDQDLPTSKPEALVLMSVCLICLPFLPATNLLFPVGFVVAERVLYIPSIGFCLLIGQIITTLYYRLARYQVLLTIFTSILLLSLGAQTFNRNWVWQSRQALFTSGVRTQPNNAKVHYNMANYWKDEGDWTRAEMFYREAIRLEPRHPSYHLNLGTVLTNETEAKLCYQEALRLRQDHPGALVNLGSLMLNHGDQSGLDLVQRALDKEPRHVEALLTMGKAMMDMSRMAEAGRYIRRALDVNPHMTSVRLYHAIYLHNTGDLVGATSEYMNVLDRDPNEEGSLQNLAKIYLTTGHPDKAKHLLLRAIKLDKTCSHCLDLLSSAYTRLGHKHEAVVTLARATELAPNNTGVVLKYVQALKESGQPEKAWTELQHLLQRAPHDMKLLAFAFNFTMERNRLKEALTLVQEIVRLAEHSRDVTLTNWYYELGDVYRLNDDMDRALQYYKKAEAEDGTNLDALSRLGAVYHHSLRFTEGLERMKLYQLAEEYYQKVLAIDNNFSNGEVRKNLQRLRNSVKQKSHQGT